MDKRTVSARQHHRARRWGGCFVAGALLATAGLYLATRPAGPVSAGPVASSGALTASLEPLNSSLASNESTRATPAASAAAPGPVSIPDEALAMIPWQRYPSGLQAAAELALQRRDGRQAYVVAGDLQACQGLAFALRALESSLNRSADAARRQLLQQQWSARLKDSAFCQAVPGDVGALRVQLLTLAMQQEVAGSGTDLALAGQGSQPSVIRQVLREMELGHARALSMVADGMMASATPLQVAAARDAIVRGARDPDLQGPGGPELDQELDFLQRRAVVDAWKTDPGNGGKREAASRAWNDAQGGARLAPSTDPQVRALADQYLAALKRRHKAPQSGG